MKRFEFSFLVNHTLSADQIWPNGEVPENPSAEDARQQFLNTCYSVVDGMREWGIGPDADDLVVTELAEGKTFNGK